MKSFRENIIKNGVLFLLFVLPLLVISNLAFSFISIKTFFFYGCMELIFVFWLYTITIDKTYFLKKKQILFFIPVILYIIWMSISGVFAADPSLSFWGPIERGTGLLTLYHCLILSMVVVSLINHYGKNYLNKLLKYFLLGSFILSISVWLGNEGLNTSIKIFSESRGGGFIGNSSFAAAYLIFSLFICFYILFDKQTSKIKKIFTSIIIFTILLSPLFINIHGLFTGTGLLGSARGALLGIVIGIITVLICYLILCKNKILKILGIISVFILMVTFIIGWSELMKPNTYIHNKFKEVASSTRFIFWNIAQVSMNEHPYFGYGPENYMIAFRENFDIKILDGNQSPEAWSDKAHNIYFDTGVSGGYPAIIFYGIFLISIFYAIYRAYKINRISRIQTSLLFGMFIAYIFQDLFVFDSPVSMVALFMTIGIIYSLQINEVKEKYIKTKINTSILSIITFILFVSFIFSFINFSYLPLKKSREFLRVISLSIDKRPSEYQSLLGGSNIGNDWDASFFAYSMYLNYSSHIKELKSDPNIISYVDADLTAYIDYLNKLAETNKTDYRLYLSMLHIYNIKVNIINKKFSAEEFNHILDIANFAHNLLPIDPQVYWDVGFLKLYQGDSGGAFEEYKKAVYLDKTNKFSWIMMLKFLKGSGNQIMYDAAFKEARMNIPDFSM